MRAPTFIRQLKRGHLVQIGILSAVLVVLVILVPIFADVNSKASKNKADHRATTRLDPIAIVNDDADPEFSGLLLAGNVVDVNQADLTFKVRFQAQPYGDLATTFNETSAYIRLNKRLQFLLNNDNRTFAAGQTIPIFDKVVPFTDSSPFAYPFDKYSSLIAMSTYNGDSLVDTVPMAISLSGGILGWSVDMVAFDYQNEYGIVLFTVVISRAETTKFFSMLVLLLLWVLSLSVFTLAVTLWIRDRKVEPPTMAVATALLFALPALRNSQPGAPPIGCTADVAGFFWNMLITGLACFLLILNYIVKYRREKPAPKIGSPPKPSDASCRIVVQSSAAIDAPGDVNDLEGGKPGNVKASTHTLT